VTRILPKKIFLEFFCNVFSKNMAFVTKYTLKRNDVEISWKFSTK
jgi:hypothetical protein